ncbi:hypothetical protein Tco_0445701 [Tanacetum coccineum]
MFWFDLPTGAKVIGTKRVYRNKKEESRSSCTETKHASGFKVIDKKKGLTMMSCMHSPWETKLPLTKDEEAFDVDVHLYRSMIGNSKDFSSQLLSEDIQVTSRANPPWSYGILGDSPLDLDAFLIIRNVLSCLDNLAGQPQPSADPTPSQSIPAISVSHVQIPQPSSVQPPPQPSSVQPPPQPSSVQPTDITPPTQPVQTTSPPPVSSIPEIQPTQPPSPQIPSPSFHDTEGPSFEPSYHMSPPPSHEPEIQASISSEESEQLRNLMDIVPRLESRVKTLEKELSETKQTLGTAILQLIEKVKKLENKLKKKRKSKETKDAEDQDQEVPFETDQGDTFVTPEKSKGSGEAQEEQISPSTLEAAQILHKSQVNTGEINAAEVNTGEAERRKLKECKLKWMLKQKDKLTLSTLARRIVSAREATANKALGETEFDYIKQEKMQIQKSLLKRFNKKKGINILIRKEQKDDRATKNINEKMLIKRKKKKMNQLKRKFQEERRSKEKEVRHKERKFNSKKEKAMASSLTREDDDREEYAYI